MTYLKTFLKAFYFYIALTGTVGFSLFIMEEGIQLLSFAMFTTSDTQRWDIAKANTERMRSIQGHMRVVNACFMWIQPFQCYSYGDYIDAIDGYLDSQESMIMAMDPGLWVGERVSFKFYYRTVSGNMYRSNRLCVKLTTKPVGNPILVTGIMTRVNNSLYEVR